MSILENPVERQGKKYITAYLNCDVIKKLDEFRGEVPRNKVVQRAINQFLEREHGNKS